MISDKIFGGCKILCESGSGAYGTVYLAKDALNRTVAIKIFHASDNLTRNLDGLRKCITSFKDNEGLLKIFHCGFDDNHIFYVMEAADNATPDKAYTPDTLAYRLRDGRRLSLDESLAICRSIAITCQKLHSQGMVHRDLKPENVIFVNGQPKVGDLDFLSDYNRTMSLVGSLGFIPPEFLSLQSLPKSTATDLYAIGKLFYCCVTGLPPEAYPKLPDDLPVDILYRICIPLSKLCSKTPSDRPATCEELLALLPDANAPLRKATIRQRLALLFTQRPWLRHAIDIFLLVAILAFGTARAVSWRRNSAERKREEALLKTKRQKVYDVLHALRMSDGYLEPDVLNDFKRKIDEAASIHDYKEIGKIDDVLHQMQSYILNKSNETGFMKSIYNSSSFDEKLRNLDAAFAFLHSPLARTFEDGSLLRMLEDDLLFHAKNVFSDMPFGSDFKLNNLDFQFVPSKNASSPRCFWIMQNDISHESFYQICKYRRIDGKHGAEHVENLCLNDMLACSRAVKMQIDNKIRMPPGYIVRPPTVGELERFFEFTAWGGNDRKLKRNPIKRPIPAIAAISDEAPYTIQLYMDPVRNTGYKTLPPDSQANASYTLRLAIAPGDDSFYEKAYGSGVEFHSAEKDGRIYAGLSCNVAFTTIVTARNLAATLNAKLVEPASFHEWMRIHALVFPYSHSPAFIGLNYQDGAWRRFSDGAVVNSSNLLPTDTYGGSVYLIANKTNFAAIKPTFRIPSILLQWDSKEQWERRGDALRGNLCAPSSANVIERIITIGGRRFALANITLFPSYVVAPFCRYMDVKPAVFKDKKEMEEACRLLSDVNGTIALGALRHYDDWQWCDGTIESLSPQPERQTNHSIATSPMLDCLAIENGKLASAASVSFVLIDLN